MKKMAEVGALQAEVETEEIGPRVIIESNSRLAPRFRTQALIMLRLIRNHRQKVMQEVSLNDVETTTAIAEVEVDKMVISRLSSSISLLVNLILLTKGKPKRLHNLSAKR